MIVEQRNQVLNSLKTPYYRNEKSQVIQNWQKNINLVGKQMKNSKIKQKHHISIILAY